MFHCWLAAFAALALVVGFGCETLELEIPQSGGSTESGEASRPAGVASTGAAVGSTASDSSGAGASGVGSSTGGATGGGTSGGGAGTSGTLRCEPGERACDRNVAQICDVDGVSWLVAETCDSDSVCREGFCEEGSSSSTPSDAPSSSSSSVGIVMPDCACTQGGSASVDAALDAIGLCDGSVNSADRRGDARQYSVKSDYFGVHPPGDADCLLLMSTGIADTPQRAESAVGSGGVLNGHVFSATTVPSPRPGDDRNVYDLAQLSLELSPPEGARGFRFDFMFLSAEWPQFLCQQFNDTFLTVVESKAVNGGAPTNISVDSEGNEVSINLAQMELPRLWTSDLTHTPFGQRVPLDPPQYSACFLTPPPESGCVHPEYCDGTEDLAYVGTGTGWLSAAAPISTSEATIQLHFSIHDEGDAVGDSKVLIANFEWLDRAPPEGILR